MQKHKIRFKHRIEYGVLRTIQVCITLFPISWVGAFLSGLLRFVFRCFWPLKKESIARMREVFGEDLPVSRCRVIARTSVWNLMMNFVEVFHAKKMDEAYLKAHLAGAEEAKAKLAAIIDKYGGAVIALPHMGNWDLAGIAASMLGYPLMAIARPQNNPLVERWMVANRLSIITVDRRKPTSFVRIAHHLKSRGLFAILPDVRHNKPGVSVTVFGKPNVQLGKGVAKFARMANVPIVPFMMERLDASHHTLTLGEPIFPDVDVDFDQDAVRITQTLWDIFEARIREKPEQWFWHNRRWILTPLYTKTR